jgi:hypothetical protein
VEIRVHSWLISFKRVGLDSAEPFGPEFTAEGLVAGCADQILENDNK